MRPLQSTTQFQSYPPVSGLTLVDLESPPGIPATQIVGVSAVWRKLLMQAEMAAPHLQVAALEGEPGSGKQTLARYLFSRSPLANTTFQRRDAREWLVSDADPATLAGFTYLDRVDLLAPPGQGLLLSILKALQDRPTGRAVLLASSHASLRQMAGQGLLMPDLAFRLSAVRFAVPPSACAAKTSPPWPSASSNASAPAISSDPWFSEPARSPASSSIPGPAISANSPPSSKPPSSKPPTASSAPPTSPSPPAPTHRKRGPHAQARTLWVVNGPRITLPSPVNTPRYPSKTSPSTPSSATTSSASSTSTTATSSAPPASSASAAPPSTAS